MAQSLIIIEPARAFTYTGTSAKNRNAVQVGSAVTSENSAPVGHSNTRNIEYRAARDGQRELACANDFYAAILAMATHDLRQPLQVIVGCHALLADQRMAGPQRRHLERAQRASRELAAKLDQLTDALRVQQQSGSIRKEPVRLEPLFQRIAAQLAEPAREKRIDLRFRPTGVTIVSSPVMLDGIVRNLVRNALEHTATGGRVLVGCRRRGTEIRIEVHDKGAGIAQDQLRHVFEPFARLDIALPAGLGLGLFIVKRAADYLGHRIEVSSAPGQGCCFAVAAPVVE
jgi:signal transduction histidine kinase